MHTPDEHFWSLVQQVVFLPLRALQSFSPLSHSSGDVRGFCVDMTGERAKNELWLTCAYHSCYLKNDKTEDSKEEKRLCACHGYG